MLGRNHRGLVIAMRHLFWLAPAWLIGVTAAIYGCQPQGEPAAPPKPTVESAPAKSADPTPTTEPAGGPKFACDAPVHDFGEFWVPMEPIPHTFEFKNVGTETLKVLKVKTGCGCTQTGAYTKEVAPGEIGSIPVALDASRLSKNFRKNITVTVNDPVNSNVELTLTGTPKRYIDIEPKNVSFGEITADKHVNGHVVITNHAETPLTLDLVEDAEWGKFKAKLVEKEPGRLFELEVTGEPPYDENVNRGNFRLTSNLPQQPSLLIYATANVPPRLQVLPQAVEFREPAKVPLDRRVMFTNRGDTMVALLYAGVDDPNVQASVKVLTEGKHYQVNLTFPANYDPPPEGAHLTLRTDDPEAAEMIVPIVRKGPAPRNTSESEAPYELQ